MDSWLGKFLGALAGAAILRGHPLLGAIIGLLLGHAFDARGLKVAHEDPYAVLGVAAHASDADVDLAYRRLMSQHHPDKLTGAADDARRQAERRARNINIAYGRIKTLRGRS